MSLESNVFLEHARCRWHDSHTSFFMFSSDIIYPCLSIHCASSLALSCLYRGRTLHNKRCCREPSISPPWIGMPTDDQISPPLAGTYPCPIRTSQMWIACNTCLLNLSYNCTQMADESQSVVGLLLFKVVPRFLDRWSRPDLVNYAAFANMSKPIPFIT